LVEYLKEFYKGSEKIKYSDIISKDSKEEAEATLIEKTT